MAEFEFNPDGEQPQSGAIEILWDVISRYERGELDEGSAREELRRRLGWEPPLRASSEPPFSGVE